MTPYYEGTSEAEHVIRGSPELVERWLNKARLDRSRLAVRLFQPQRKEFLDGFINSLEGHLENLATRKLSANPRAELPVVTTVVVEDVAPVTEDISGPVEPQAAVDVESIVPEVQPDSPPGLLERSAGVEAVATQVESRPQSAPDEIDFAGERALGVMRLSGWTVDVDPQEIASSEDGDCAADRLDGSPGQTGEPVTPMAWNRLFEEARGVSMVDLSAYDFIDRLGELRELIDHWQALQQDTTSGDTP